MFLYDIGVVPVQEPFKKVIHNGMILGPDGHKMSKSRGNVVNPDDYDPDELRLYLAFIAHFFDGGTWSDRNIKGVRKFLSRYKEWMSREGDDVIPELDSFVKNIHSLTDSFKFNKVVSEYMTLVNKYRHLNLTPQNKNTLSSVLSSFVPSM
jgi:leucyl-tRNA synthetase